MKVIMRLVLVLLAIGLLAFLIRYIGTHNMGVFNPKGVIALYEKNLIVIVTLLMLIVVIPVFTMLFSFAWRYREGNKKAKYTPDWHNNIALEIIWWAIPTVIVVLIGIITWKSTHDLDPFRPLPRSGNGHPPITIQVVALDWKWLFIYPEENIATVNFLEIPEGIPIEFSITSDAPMNAFWIPQLGTQIYAMAGMNAKLHLNATELGDYDGVSSNFSGDGFAGMKFVTHVVTHDDFHAWVDTVKYTPEALTYAQYGELAKQSKNNPIRYYGSVEGGLYDKIIMKYMPSAKSSQAANQMENGEAMDVMIHR